MKSDSYVGRSPPGNSATVRDKLDHLLIQQVFSVARNCSAHAIEISQPVKSGLKCPATLARAFFFADFYIVHKIESFHCNKESVIWWLLLLKLCGACRCLESCGLAAPAVSPDAD